MQFTLFNDTPTMEYNFLELITDPYSNAFLLDAGLAGYGITYEFIDYGSIKTTVAISQGPAAYEYPPLKFLFRSKCDHLLFSSVSITLEWMEPCSQVEFGGPIAREGTFYVNMETE